MSATTTAAPIPAAAQIPSRIGMFTSLWQHRRVFTVEMAEQRTFVRGHLGARQKGRLQYPVNGEKALAVLLRILWQRTFGRNDKQSSVMQGLNPDPGQTRPDRLCAARLSHVSLAQVIGPERSLDPVARTERPA